MVLPAPSPYQQKTTTNKEKHHTFSWSALSDTRYASSCCSRNVWLKLRSSLSTKTNTHFKQPFFRENLSMVLPERQNNSGINAVRDDGLWGWQWHQLDHMQTICTSLQTENHTNTSSLNFYRPDALPDAQPTMSKHWKQLLCRANTLQALWESLTLSLTLCSTDRLLISVCILSVLQYK